MKLLQYRNVYSYKANQGAAYSKDYSEIGKGEVFSQRRLVKSTVELYYDLVEEGAHWQQVDIGGVAMWSRPNDPVLHLEVPNGTPWSKVEPGVLPGFTPEGFKTLGKGNPLRLQYDK